MAPEPVIIPEKIYFKIGEVCDILGVQPHVLRYWETEFPMLSPQKNKSGQRSYRRRDVEMAVRIKQLLYNEMFTIAGARKKLQTESRNKAARQEQQPPEETQTEPQTEPRPESPSAAPTQAPQRNDGRHRDFHAPMLFDTSPEPVLEVPHAASLDGNSNLADSNYREALRTVAGQLLELRELLKSPRP